MRATLSIATCLFLTAGLLAASTAGAFSFGTDDKGITDVKTSAVQADVAQIWIGDWTNDWTYLDRSLNTMKSQGVTPEIEWYYWGNDISPSNVKYGTNGKSRAEWDAKATTLAKHVRSIMGDKPVIIVLETEFNKNGIGTWSGYNSEITRQIGIFRTHAPNAKLVIGFGSWKQTEYATFAPAMAKADYAGFQMMKASTRSSLTSYLNTPNEILAQTKLLKSLFGKPVLLYDLALSTYGGWTWAQKDVFTKIAAKYGEYTAAGLIGITLRSVRDDPKAPTWDWFGAAEAYFGLKTSGGTAKPAWWIWVALAKAH